MENFPQNGKKFLYTNIEINNKVPWTELWFWLSVHCTENHIFLFPDVLKRWSFQKNCARIWSFLHYWERWYFFFPKIWSYILGGKWKMIFLKKIHGDMIFSLNLLKRWSFQEGPRRHMIFLVSSGEMVFFSPKTYFSPSSGNTWKFDIFCVLVRVLQACHHTPPSKKIYQFSVLSWWPLRAFSCIAP